MHWSVSLAPILATACAPLDPLPDALTRASLLDGERVRIVAANLTSGNGQTYDHGHGRRILTGLDPDIVLVQELNYLGDVPADHQAFAANIIGAGAQVCRETGAAIPNAVLSRWPITACGVWNDPYVGDREFVWSRIDIPGDRDLWAVSIHLLHTSSSKRRQEAASLVGLVEHHIPADDYLVIGGDLNVNSASEGALNELAEVVTDFPRPVDQDGNANTNRSRSKPYDWVLPDADLAARAIPVFLGDESFDTGLVFDSRRFDPLDDVTPVLPGDSGASQMQHMAVVKDFSL